MSIKRDGYFYDQQLKSYVLQFMAIFTGLQVMVGKRDEQENRLISVPIHYGNQDRVVASIMAQNTQNTPLRLPVMSAFVRNLSVAMNRMAGVGAERRHAYVPVGGLVPDDIQVIHQRKPVPYDLDIELSIYASNTDQFFQMLEQIMPLFEPQLTIQTSDGPFDWKRLTHVELTNVQMEPNYPVGIDRRIIQATLMFRIPIYFDIPAQIRKDFVQRVMLRVGAVDTSAMDNFDIIADLDGQGIPYQTVIDSTDLTIDQN